MPFCPRCGERTVEVNSHCRVCGASLGEKALARTEPEGKVSFGRGAPVGLVETGRSKAVWLISSFIIALILVSIFGFLIRGFGGIYALAFAGTIEGIVLFLIFLAVLLFGLRGRFLGARQVPAPNEIRARDGRSVSGLAENVVRGVGWFGRGIAWFVLCSILALVPLMAIGFTAEQILGAPENSTLPVLLLFPLILAALLYKSKSFFFPYRFEGGELMEGGRVARGRGLVEGTVRNVEVREPMELPIWLGFAKPKYRVLRFRVEVSDAQGRAEHIPVEIRSAEGKWVGVMSQGDSVRVVGKFRSDGMLYAKRGHNLTTKSLVGER